MACENDNQSQAKPEDANRSVMVLGRLYCDGLREAKGHSGAGELQHRLLRKAPV